MENLGEKLKSLRLDLGLTQTEMAAGVISVSFYSKVERGLHSIGANQLLEILEQHNIDFQEFFSGLKEKNSNKEEVTELMNKFIMAANEDNDKEISEIIRRLKKIKPRTAFIKFSILQAKLIANTHDANAIKKLSYEQKAKIKKVIFQKDTDENEYYRIVLIANIIRIYNFEEATFLVKSIIRRYQLISKMGKKIELALSVLMINYINWCVEKKEYEYCTEPLAYLKKLPNIIELAFTKILGKYFEDLINNKLNDANKIREVLNSTGYSTFVRKMSK